jgi:hypothetical protein
MAPAAAENSSVAYTQAAQTVVAQLTPLPLTQTAMYTPLPTVPVKTPQPPTAAPTTEPTYTLEPIGPLPIIQVTGYNYCREGPGDNYVVDEIVYPGDAFTPQGKNADGSWWYVAAPKQHRKRPAEHCWISNSAVSTSGDPTRVPIITPTPVVTPTVSAG